ncbi:MAG: hypothetical protein U1C74_18490, partial [Phenylobacterium sp.]|nr:hypothetical protein [Phenylobacterium sp.]
MTRNFIAALAATAGLAFVAAPAQATVFTGTWELTEYETTDPGLVLGVWGGDDGAFDLDLGSDPIQSFDLFKLYTNEASVNGDDLGSSLISLTFTFTAPTPNNGPITIGGETQGYATFFGIVQGGVLTWNDGGTALFKWAEGEPGVTDPGRMTISVNGGTFNEGLFGLHEGKKHGLKVAAQFHWDNDPTFTTAVPEPATWALMI